MCVEGRTNRAHACESVDLACLTSVCDAQQLRRLTEMSESWIRSPSFARIASLSLALSQPSHLLYERDGGQ